MKIYTFKAKQKLPITLDEAWSFLSDPKNLKLITSLFVFGLFLGACTNKEEATETETGSTEEVASEIREPINDDHMKLGAFSMSLSVKDLKTSKEFYEKASA